jgi:hypothetical protein
MNQTLFDIAWLLPDRRRAHARAHAGARLATVPDADLHPLGGEPRPRNHRQCSEIRTRTVPARRGGVIVVGAAPALVGAVVVAGGEGLPGATRSVTHWLLDGPL